jgi:hypothetical protein
VRVAIAALISLVVLAGAWAQDTKDEKPPRRFGLEADLEKYPQAAPKDTLGSVLKAIAAKRIDYLLAHLADPDFVDMRVKDYGGNFDEVVKEAQKKLADDPAVVKQMQRFYKDGEWDESDTMASVRLKEGKERIYFRKVGNRWFLENRKKEEEKRK